MLAREFLEKWSEKKPNETALIFKDKEYSYFEINNKSESLKMWLFDRNIKKGDRVIIWGKNNEKAIISIFGILKAGAIFVPVAPDIPLSRLDFIIGDCKPKAMIIDSSILEERKLNNEYFENNEVHLLLTEQFQLSGRNIDYWDALNDSINNNVVEICGDYFACIIYTSGSTKEPKGVLEKHKQVLFATSAINEVLCNGENDVILCGIPISFDFGLYQIFLAFQSGAKLILEEDFSIPMAIPRILKKYDITAFPGVPSIFAMLLKTRLLEKIELPKLRYISSTGDVFPVSHIQKLSELLPSTEIIPMYGLTECKRVSIMPLGRTDKKVQGSVGLPLPGTKVMILDDSGKQLQNNEIGELVIEGPHVMEGYWENEIETKKKFVKDNLRGQTLLYSGDLFKQDKDGFLYFVGRKDLFIKSKGQKISPAEIENLLCSIQGIIQVAVIGVKDEILGESIVAFVMCEKESTLNPDLIISKCKDSIPFVMCPQKVFIIDELPKTKNGKIDRNKLMSVALNDN